MSPNDPDDLDARMRALRPEGRRNLLDELESIRGLLDDARSDAGERREPAPDLDRIPVLDEIVKPARPSAAGAPGRTEGADAATSAGTESQGDLFDPRAFADRLLNDDWRRERDAIVAAARLGARALGRPADAPPDRTLEPELQARLQAALEDRVGTVLQGALEDLRDVLRHTVRRELERLLDDCFGDVPASTPAAGRPGDDQHHRQDETD